MPLFPSDIYVASLAELTDEGTEERHLVVLQGKECLPRSGRLRCDFQEGTVSFFKPCCAPLKLLRQREMVDAVAVCFRQQIFPFHIPCDIAQYPFFDYKQNEALHLSVREKAVLDDCIGHILAEKSWGYDVYSEKLMTQYLKLLLDYCQRFYDRQFITRSHLYDPLVARVERSLDEWIQSGCLCLRNPEAVASYFAHANSLSPAYFRTMIEKKSGMSVEQLIVSRQLRLAKEQLTQSDLPIDAIASRLLFASRQQLDDLFEASEGCTPEHYRRQSSQTNGASTPDNG